LASPPTPARLRGVLESDVRDLADAVDVVAPADPAHVHDALEEPSKKPSYT